MDMRTVDGETAAYIRSAGIEVYKIAISIFQELSGKPGYHNQVKKFVLAISQLKKVSFMPFDYLEADDVDLRKMISDAYNTTIAVMDLELKALYYQCREDEATDLYAKIALLKEERQEALKMLKALAPESRQTVSQGGNANMGDYLLE